MESKYKVGQVVIIAKYLEDFKENEHRHLTSVMKEAYSDFALIVDVKPAEGLTDSKDDGFNYYLKIQEVKPFRWRAEPGGAYHIVCTTMDVMRLYDIRESSDNKLYENGNYFRTKEEAEEMAKKIKKVLLQNK